MHDLDIIHGGLKTVSHLSHTLLCHLGLMSQANVLVDKEGAPHLAGLGNAYIPLHSTIWMLEDRMGTEHAYAPELTAPETLLDWTDSAHSTKAINMYAFGVMAFEVRISFEQYFIASLTRNRFSRDTLRFSTLPRLQWCTRC